MTVRFRWGAVTDVGRVREINQDAVHAEEGLFIVADGMGGHRGGEVASAVAIESMTNGGQAPTTLDQLLGRVHEANAAIIERASGDVELAGMGTTVCAVAMLRDPGETEPSRLGIVNVGDSRVYRFADDELVQVTEDHSLVETLVREGRITADEARSHPQRNILTRALGIGHDLQVDYWELPIHLGDLYLLCSDGLFNEVTDAQIAATLRRLADPAEVVDELVRMANEGGSRDNVSVVIACVDSGPDEQAPPVPRPIRSAPVTAEFPVVNAPLAYATDEPGFGEPARPDARAAGTCPAGGGGAAAAGRRRAASGAFSGAGSRSGRRRRPTAGRTRSDPASGRRRVAVERTHHPGTRHAGGAPTSAITAASTAVVEVLGRLTTCPCRIAATPSSPC